MIIQHSAGGGLQSSLAGLNYSLLMFFLPISGSKCVVVVWGGYIFNLKRTLMFDAVLNNNGN